MGSSSATIWVPKWVLFFYLAKHKQKQFNTITSYNIEN
jgi:hypothetical protein